MARLLSNAILKGISHGSASPSPSPRIVSAFFNHDGLRYSTNVPNNPDSPNDPDSHEDFKPKNKVEKHGIDFTAVVEKDVKDNPVVIYMKGYPELPRCGFSALAVRVLKQYNVPLTARDILEYPDLKNGVKAYSNWPTFPQIFIKGEFIGGSDIIVSMHQSGELKEKLQDIAGNQSNSS